MTTPLLLQALEINTLIWRKFPFVRYTWQWNPEKHQFEPEESSKRIFVWLLSSTVSFGFLFILHILLLTVGLKAPHNDKLQNWIVTFELFPCVTYIFLYNWRVYSIGIPNFIAYHNSLTQILKTHTAPCQIVSRITPADRDIKRFARCLLRGKSKIFTHLYIYSICVRKLCH